MHEPLFAEDNWLSPFPIKVGNREDMPAAELCKKRSENSLSIVCAIDIPLPELINLAKARLKKSKVIADTVRYLPGQYALLSVKLVRHSSFHLIIRAVTHIDYKNRKEKESACSNNNKFFRSDIYPSNQNMLIYLPRVPIKHNFILMNGLTLIDIVP
jgi:hypothetical protein